MTKKNDNNNDDNLKKWLYPDLSSGRCCVGADRRGSAARAAGTWSAFAWASVCMLCTARIHTYIHTYLHTYVYLHIRRERDIDREREHTHMYMYIYIYTYIHTYRHTYIHTDIHNFWSAERLARR